MAYDGSLKFDTGIDTEGFKDGVSSLNDAMGRLTSAVERLSETIIDAFQGAGKAAESIGGKAKASAANVEEIGEAAKRSRKELEALNEQAQMDAITFTRHDDQLPDLPDEGTRTEVLTDNFKEYGNDVQQFVDNYAANMDAAEQHTNEFKQEIEILTAQLKELERQGLYFGDEAYDEAFMRLSASKQALSEYRRELTEPLQLPDAEIPVRLDMDSFEGQKQALKQQLQELESKGTTLGNAEYDSLYVALQRVLQAEKEYKKSLVGVDAGQKKAANSADKYRRSLDGVARSSKKTDKAAVPLTKSILKLGNMFKLMLLRMAMRAVIDGVKEGMQNLAQYSDEVNSSLSSLQSSSLYLKNSFATAFAPILSYVIPALNALIDAIATALAWIAQLFAALSGKGTYVKAKKTQEDYAASLKKTGGAAKAAGKEAERSTASFDKLNLISEQGSGSGGGGSSGGTDPSEMFETVAVSSELVNILDLLKAKWNEVASLFSSGFSFGMGDATSRLDTIKKGLQSIRNSLVEIFTDPAVQGAADNWAKTMIYNLGVIAGSIGSIGLTIAANLIGGISIYLEEAKDRIKEYLISMFDISAESGTIVANFSAAIAEIFSVFAEENGQMFTANLIGFFAEAFMGVTELAAKSGRDILDMLLTPITENAEGFRSAFDGLLGVAAQVMGDLRKIVTDSFSKMNQVYDRDIKPMFDSFTEGFTEIYAVALEAFETHILPALQRASDMFSEFREKYLQPLIDQFIELGGKVAEMSRVHFEALTPLYKWLTGEFAQGIGKTIDNIGAIFSIVGETIVGVVSGILTVLGGLIDFLMGVFTGDMELALNGIKDIFRGIFNAIISLVEGAVNHIVFALNNIKVDVPEWIPGIGGNKFGFNLKKVNLPRLATGTVVPPRSGEFAAILGDNNRETEIVSPLSTMRQALGEALQMYGGTGGGDINLTVELDGDTVFQTVVKKTRAAVNSTGDNPLLVT